MKKSKMIIFLAFWLILGIAVTAVNSLGAGHGEGHGETTPTAAHETA